MYAVDSITSHSLLSGIPGTYQTLDHMAAIVRQDVRRPDLRQAALEIVSGCKGHDFDCEIKTLFEYVRDQITFRRDPIDQERVQDSLRTMGVFKSGDCDDKCVCLASLLGSLGHRSRFVVIGSRTQFSHVYLEVETKDKKWIPLDPTPETARPGWEAKAPKREVYEIWKPQTDIAGFLLVGFLVWLIYRK